MTALMDPTWPPDGESAELLTRLALLVAQGGAGHLLDGPVACADERDFPEPWQRTAAAVERLLLRLLWLGHADLDVAVDDLRNGDAREALLTRSAIEWSENRDGVARFQLASIGNDNVAGALAHEVGRAFVAWQHAADPYRDIAAEPPSARDGTIAAVYLGLGVLAANAAAYHRMVGNNVGSYGVTRSDVVVTGGLSTQAVLYLLAVQAVLRDAPIPAHATLRGELRARLDDLRRGLAPHRAALAEHLGIELDAPRPALARAPAPPTVSDAERPEPDHRGRRRGQRTYRHSRTLSGVYAPLGAVAGVVVAGIATLFGAPQIVLAVLLLAPSLGASIVGGFRNADYCARCSVGIPASAETCPGCGATVAGRIARLAELDARELARDD